ncbi:ferric reductase [Drechmeria coniospora]|uniref:ferric-chelate reductase (NADPH) n=1 Tax=Drechmeria coniospora TaxID=98403 RepID=A0A151GV24_DRECN|nr:ferric reductase [Drechmeria coniospora]KYK60920.1 ferric reductase [Drechmeria coniospora]ODA83609.1 hypothetical protein RJ55_02124 [Drechmeria coniospora]
MATINLVPREATDTLDESAEPSSTIAPFHTALNGVNQPLNMTFKDVLWWTLGIAGLLILAIRILELVWAKLRQFSAMTQPREKQTYWKTSQWSWMPALKKHVTYAPLWNKRHNREIRLSSAINIGTLPSRLQFVLLALYLCSNAAYIFALNYGVENKFALCAELRGRSGTLAVVNMVPLVIFAGRNNPLIALLRISFDTYNLLHRWIGRIVVVEAVIHTVAWAIPAVADQGWAGAFSPALRSWFLGSGFVGTASLVLLLLQSLSPVRHAFYETFLNIHMVLAIVIFGCTWIHCTSGALELPQLSWIMAIVALWLADRVARTLRLALVNWSSRGFTDAFCEALPGDVTRVTLHLPRYMDIKPGTHAYLRFRGVMAWQSHPFSIAWVEHQMKDELLLAEKEPLNTMDRKRASTAVSFIIGAQTGMTRRLFERASLSTGGIRIGAAMEGPYAGHHSLDSYGHAVLFAGSTGITHQFSYLRGLIKGYNDGSVATRRVTLVWIVRSYESLEWVRPFMDSVLRLPNRKDILRIQVFVTRPDSRRNFGNNSQTVNVLYGRPNIPLILFKEVQDQIGAMAVSVCGPGGLADDVRGAVRMMQGDNVIDFVEESFTW